MAQDAASKSQSQLERENQMLRQKLEAALKNTVSISQTVSEPFLSQHKATLCPIDFQQVEMTLLTLMCRI